MSRQFTLADARALAAAMRPTWAMPPRGAPLPGGVVDVPRAEPSIAPAPPSAWHVPRSLRLLREEGT